jgi:hypothetical protein
MRLTSLILVCVALLLALGVAHISATRTGARRYSDFNELEVASEAATELVSNDALEAKPLTEARQATHARQSVTSQDPSSLPFLHFCPSLPPHFFLTLSDPVLRPSHHPTSHRNKTTRRIRTTTTTTMMMMTSPPPTTRANL